LESKFQALEQLDQTIVVRYLTA
jgi:hypothetical protein